LPLRLTAREPKPRRSYSSFGTPPLELRDARKQAKAEASAEFEQAARGTSVGRTVERDPVVAALIERLERRADTKGEAVLTPCRLPVG
jgi:hypothetical protein